MRRAKKKRRRRRHRPVRSPPHQAADRAEPRRPSASRAPHLGATTAPARVVISLLLLLPLLVVVLVDCSRPTGGPAASGQRQQYLTIETDRGQLFQGVRLRPHAGWSSSRPDRDEDQPVFGFFGIRYASAPIRRLRFMPPAPFNYAPNQVNQVHKFGPICMQKFPLDLPLGLGASTRTATGHIKDADHDHNQAAAAGGGKQILARRRLGDESSSPMAGLANEAPDDDASDASDDDGNDNDNDNDGRHSSWRAQRNGTRAASSSMVDMQIDLLLRQLLAGAAYQQQGPLIRRLITKFEQSEDCLNLNIYVPHQDSHSANSTSTTATTITPKPGEPTTAADPLARGPPPKPSLRPVLVLVHGDSFDFGSGSLINGQKFARHQRQLVVTFNYRLNILGFPPAVLAPNSRPNLGLLDQLAALHWIKDNIRAFGGSPDRITLMGLKRGAIFVHLLALSPLAKGLFQRIVLEDGSALSPMVANRISAGAPSYAHTQAHAHATATSTGNTASERSLEHFRLLSKLNECPVYHRRPAANFSAPSYAHASLLNIPPAPTLTSTTTSTLNPSATAPAIAANTANKPATSREGHYGDGDGDGDDDGDEKEGAPALESELRAANMLALECLRHKPVEQIVQRIPLDLLQFNRRTGAVQLSARWSTKLKQVTGHSSSSLSNLPDLPGANPTNLTTNSPEQASAQEQHQQQQQQQHQPVLVENWAQLRRLIDLVTGEFLKEQLSEQSKSHGNRRKRLDQPESDYEQLFRAIHAPSDPLRPLFGPQLDSMLAGGSGGVGGSVGAGDSPPGAQQPLQVDQLMLASNQRGGGGGGGQLFARRDLLIGWSTPITAAAAAATEPSADHQTDNSDPNSDSGSESAPTPLATTLASQRPHLLADQLLDAKLEARGLGDEQAIELVGAFVGSFYRFHQQEISNSIINHYLAGQWRSTSLSPHLVAVGQDNNAAAAGAAASGAANPDTGPSAGEPTMAKRQQQLLLLGSILEATQDALVNVPLFKTALIHATRQLEPLARLFVSQQLRLASRPRASSGSGDAVSTFQPKTTTTTWNESNWTNKARLMDEFVAFASSLLDDDDNHNHEGRRWPPELVRQAPDGSDQRTDTSVAAAANDDDDDDDDYKLSSTYLYQFDASQLVGPTRRAIKLLAAERTSNSSRPVRDQILAKLSEELDGLVRGPGELVARSPHRQLGFACALNSDEDDDSIVGEIVCSRLAHVLGQFVETGNVNLVDEQHELESGDADEPETKSREPVIEALLCGQTTTTTTTSDHHAVQLSSEQPVSSAKHCPPPTDELVTKLARDYLTRSRLFKLRPSTNWKKFSVFKQHLARLVAPSSLWKLESLNSPDNATSEHHHQGNSKQQQQQQQLLLVEEQKFLAKVSFWSNFLPALNCSRTQPINPTLLLQSSNSTILNLNLMFNCHHHQQQQQRYTINSMLNSLTTRYIRQQLVEQLERERKQALVHWSKQQQHQQHSLRMAQNMSHQEDHQQQQQHQPNVSMLAELADDQPAAVAPNGSSLHLLTVADQRQASAASKLSWTTTTINWLLGQPLNGAAAGQGPQWSRSRWLVVLVAISTSLLLVSLFVAFLLRQQRNQGPSQEAKQVASAAARPPVVDNEQQQQQPVANGIKLVNSSEQQQQHQLLCPSHQTSLRDQSTSSNTFSSDRNEQSIVGMQLLHNSGHNLELISEHHHEQEPIMLPIISSASSSGLSPAPPAELTSGPVAPGDHFGHASLRRGYGDDYNSNNDNNNNNSSRLACSSGGHLLQLYELHEAPGGAHLSATPVSRHELVELIDDDDADGGDIDQVTDGLDGVHFGTGNRGRSLHNGHYGGSSSETTTTTTTNTNTTAATANSAGGGGCGHSQTLRTMGANNGLAKKRVKISDPLEVRGHQQQQLYQHQRVVRGPQRAAGPKRAALPTGGGRHCPVHSNSSQHLSDLQLHDYHTGEPPEVNHLAWPQFAGQQTNGARSPAGCSLVNLLDYHQPLGPNRLDVDPSNKYYHFHQDTNNNNSTSWSTLPRQLQQQHHNNTDYFCAHFEQHQQQQQFSNTSNTQT